jgi:cardiolipin synthase C
VPSRVHHNFGTGSIVRGEAGEGVLEYSHFFELSDETSDLLVNSKSMVIDGEIGVVGTSNFDPRFESLNTECGAIIRDETLAKSLEMEIRRDIAPGNSWVVGKRKCIPVIGQINNLIASVSGMLPILDVWPTHYTSCFELKSGKDPLPTDHPDFNRRYKDFGGFPDCTNSPFALKTRVYKAVLGWASPAM